MDLGFNYEFYKGDVGRTLPVSGHFTQDQREVIDFMNSAYQSGLQAMHDGVSGDDIIQACIRYVENHKDGLRSNLGKWAAVELLKPVRVRRSRFLKASGKARPGLKNCRPISEGPA